MSMKEQFETVKNNWLLVLLVIIVLGASMFNPFSSSGSFKAMNSAVYDSYGGVGMAEMAVASRGYAPSYGGDFAPEVEERKITKTASLNSEVERGTFHDSEAKLKAIVTSSDSYLLNENVNKYGKDKKSYYYGYYSIKVDTAKYDSIILQLKELGEVQSFNENAQDITGSYTSVADNLALERERLARFQSMYDEAKDVSDKIELNDRIFNQERTIKYYEDSLENMDKRIEYSTVSVTLNEERSDYANIAFVKISELVDGFVDSLSNLFKFVVILIPWAVGLFIIRLFWRLFKKK